MTLFSLLIGIGGSLGLLQVARRVPTEEMLSWTAAGLSVLAAGLAGARLNFALLNPVFFNTAPLDVLRFWLGGLSWPGALLFALLALVIASLILRQPFALAADRLCPIFLAIAIMAWLGCSQAGCAYGKETLQELPWALPLLDAQGALVYRWPLQLTAAASLLLIIWRIERRSAALLKITGMQAYIFGLALALHTLFFSWLRVDHPLIYRGVRLDLAAAGGLAVLCLLGLTWLGFRHLRVSLSNKASGTSRESWLSPHD